jgi:regulator of cell morphogenesis and NO signaling
MYTKHYHRINQDDKLADIILKKPITLLMLEHFEIDFMVKNKNVSEICSEYNINKRVFTDIINLYLNILPENCKDYSQDEITSVIHFLKRSHDFYKKDKYPEILDLINQLHKESESQEIKLIEQFFKEYFEEVLEHLNYEDEVAFPYFLKIIKNNQSIDKSEDFSVKEYTEHHSDIESKLADLKNLLLKHISLKSNLSLKRKLLFNLFELEFDLKIHSLIEDNILVPLLNQFEKGEKK